MTEILPGNDERFVGEHATRYSIFPKMHVGSFIFLTIVCHFVVILATDYDTVSVEPINQSYRQWESTSSGDDMPEDIEIQVGMDGKPVVLKLKKNPHIQLDVPVTFENPESRVSSPDIKNIGFYQDVESKAAIALTRPSEERGAGLKMSGVFTSGGRQYDIEPDVNGGQSQRSNSHQVQLHRSTDNLPAAFAVPDPIRPENHERKGGNKNKTEDTFFSYNVEVLFVLDHTVWEYWLKEAGDGTEETALYNIKLHFMNVMNLVDLCFNDVDAKKDGFEITIWLKGFHIAKTVEESKWTGKALVSGSETAVDGNKVLDRFDKWSVSDGRTWYNIDHTMLWTRYNLTVDSEKIYSYGWIDGICVPTHSTSVVLDSKPTDYLSATTMIAYNLGAYPDGWEKSYGNDCDPEGPYILGHATEHDFRFSKCSIKYFKRSLSGQADGYPRICVTNRVCDHDSTPLEDVKVTTDMTNPPDLDEQCRQAYGADSYHCGGKKPKYPVCDRLPCHREYEGKVGCHYSSPGAVEYSTCDKNKWCRRGVCLSVEDNPPEIVSGDFLDPTCIATGLPTDVPKGCKDKKNWEGEVWNMTYSSCLSMVLGGPMGCFFSDVGSEDCCKTCHEYGAVTPTQHEMELHKPGDICPPGKYKQDSKCRRCPAGTYRPVSGGVQVVSCAPCERGQVSDEGSDRCTLCPPGMYSAKRGRRRCSDCPVGTYQDEPGSTECKDCPGNGEEGSGSCSDCEDKLNSKKCRKYKKKGRCYSDENSNNGKKTWAEYLEDNCKNTCQYC